MKSDIELGAEISKVCEDITSRFLQEVSGAKKDTALDILVTLGFVDWSLCDDINAGKEVSAKDVIKNLRDVCERVQSKYNISDRELARGMGFDEPTPYQDAADFYI